MVNKAKLRKILGNQFLRDMPPLTTQKMVFEHEHEWKWRFADIPLDNNTKYCTKCGKEIVFKDGKKAN